MLRSIIGENDQTSSESVNRPNAPEIAAIARLTGSAQYSWWRTAGIARTAPPAIAAIGPTRMPSRIVVSNDRSAARKFGTVVRTHTPRVSGKQMIATSHAVCRGVRFAISSRFLKRCDRARELETAAATPSSDQQRNENQLGVDLGHTITLRPWRNSASYRLPPAI